MKKIISTPSREITGAPRNICPKILASWRLGVLVLIFVFPLSAQQKIALLTPEKTLQSQTVAQKLETYLAGNFKILDDSLSEAAFRSVNYENPFNLSLKEAKNMGAAIGCDYFLLLKAQSLRRYSFEEKEFYESFAAVMS